MKYTIQAHETHYAGVTFRSRLEAKWAAFFDLVGWKWEYEPIDLPGWSPDFLIHGHCPLYVEVKPFEPKESQWTLVGRKIEESLKRAGLGPQLDEEGQIRDEEGHGTEVLLLGRAPGEDSILGLLLEQWYGDGSYDVTEAVSQNDGTDFCADYYKWRINGKYDGDHHLNRTDEDTLTRLWREAGNRVQWKPVTRGRR
jgi:hypothetical protein